MAETNMIEKVESQAKFGMGILTKKDRQIIASFLRNLERVNQHLASEVEQRVKRLLSKRYTSRSQLRSWQN